MRLPNSSEEYQHLGNEVGTQMTNRHCHHRETRLLDAHHHHQVATPQVSASRTLHHESEM
jgi:hypothetical protein